jgi:hypothetical protein
MMWLSFCDPDKPTGTQFLGACIVRAHDMLAAVALAHILGINPGGEVAGVEFDDDAPVPEIYVNKLMDKQTIAELEAAMARYGTTYRREDD